MLQSDSLMIIQCNIIFVTIRQRENYVKNAMSRVMSMSSARARSRAAEPVRR